MSALPLYSNGHTPPDSAELVPSAWVRMMYRLANLTRGNTYLISVTVPEGLHAEPTWTILCEGKTENGRKVSK